MGLRHGKFLGQTLRGADYLFGTQPAAGLIALEPHLVAGGKTLVVADGEGRNSVYLASLDTTCAPPTNRRSPK